MSGTQMMMLGTTPPTNGIISIGGREPLALNADGTVTGPIVTGSPVWVPGAPIAGIGSSYWARTTDVGSATFIPASGVWRSLAAGISYSLTGFVGALTSSIDFATDAAGVNIVNTAYFTVKNN